MQPFAKKKHTEWRYESEQSASLLSHSRSSTSTVADLVNDSECGKNVRHAPPRYSEVSSRYVETPQASTANSCGT